MNSTDNSKWMLVQDNLNYQQNPFPFYLKSYYRNSDNDKYKSYVNRTRLLNVINNIPKQYIFNGEGNDILAIYNDWPIKPKIQNKKTFSHCTISFAFFIQPLISFVSLTTAQIFNNIPITPDWKKLTAGVRIIIALTDVKKDIDNSNEKNFYGVNINKNLSDSMIKYLSDNHNSFYSKFASIIQENVQFNLEVNLDSKSSSYTQKWNDWYKNWLKSKKQYYTQNSKDKTGKIDCFELNIGSKFKSYTWVLDDFSFQIKKQNLKVIY